MEYGISNVFVGIESLAPFRLREFLHQVHRRHEIQNEIFRMHQKAGFIQRDRRSTKRETYQS
jgi:hypothetical protein